MALEISGFQQPLRSESVAEVCVNTYDITNVEMKVSRIKARFESFAKANIFRCEINVEKLFKANMSPPANSAHLSRT